MRIKKFLHIPIVFFALLMAGSCANDPGSGSGMPDTDVKLRMRINTPGAARPGTRAVAESLISEVTVMVFEYDGSDYIYNYIVQGYSLSAAGSGETYDYEFLARLLPTTVDTRLWIVANGGSTVNAATAGMTEDEVKEAVTMAYTSAGFTDVLPMTGSVDFAGGMAIDQTVNAVLVRSAAKVDVINNASNFTLTSVRVYRASDQLQLIPDALTNNRVTAPSIPAGTARDVNTVTYPVTGTSLTNQIYIPESAIPAVADRRLTATSVVVGGQFDGSTTTTYYRMDFIPNDAGGDPIDALFGQVLRNHRYVFTISEVLAAGWPSDDDASIYPSTGVELEIQVWDEETMEMVFDDYDHFGVSRRAVRLSYAAGSSGNILVDTSLDTYVAYWSDADGNILDGSTSITLGEDFDDPEGLFNASISSSGDEIIFTSLEPYDPATAETKYLVIHAGRLRIVLSVTQSPASYGTRAISVFNSTSSDIGRYGNFIVGSGWNPLPGSRILGLGNLLVGTLAISSPNFGPGSTVDMGGIYITGLALGNSMPRNYYYGSDVLYLTYDYSPTASQSESILEWLADDEHRVLIVQFDNTGVANNSGSNYTMMAALGLNRVAGSSVVPYDYAGSAAPDFVKYGPFGNLPDNFIYKCQDTTYGGIDPTAAQAAGFQPILLTGGASTTPGNYLLSVDPERRIILCGDVDLNSNESAGSTGYYLNLTSANSTTMTVDPANPAHVLMGNLWAWIVDTVLREE